jgi:phage terminase large subunit-like protein
MQRKKPLSQTDIAKRWARDVIAGKVLANVYIKLACKRFLSDLKRTDLDFREEEANRAVDYIELLPHVKDKWRGKLQHQEPWQVFGYVNIFGFYWKGTDTRKYDEAYWEITRKQGKSLMAADVGLFMLTNDGTHSPEVYCGATTEKQANYVFKPAQQMVQLSSDLREAFGVQALAQSIVTPRDDGTFQRLVGDPGDGGNPSCWIVDEYHEHKSSVFYQTGKTGMGARHNPLLLTITTAGDNIDGPCFELHEKCIKILEGSLSGRAADSVFVMIFGIDKGDDWQSEEALLKANPNANVSVSLDWLKKQQLNAIESPSDRGQFKTKHLNIWLNALERVIPYEEWEKCAAPNMQISQCKDLPCIIGVDLANAIDFVATVKNFFLQDGQRMYHFWFPQFWLPEARVYEKGAPEHYKQWHEEGFLNVCEGERITTQDIKDSIRADCKNYRVGEIVLDPWKAAGYEQDLADTGAEIVLFPQSVALYTAPMNELIACCKDNTLFHPDNKVLNWMCSNLEAKRDTNGGIKPRKENNKKKIDGMSAGIMAMGRAMTYVEQIVDFGKAHIVSSR